MSKPVQDKVEDKVEDKVDKVDEIVTIHDFKSMLVGMDLILGDKWTPDENQWQRIRKKIDALIETHERPGGVARSLPPLTGPGNVPVDSNLNVSEAELLRSFPSVPVDNSVPIGEAGPAGQSALTPPPMAAVPIVTGNPPAPVADGSGGNVKTPDIDSRAGYKSGFV